MWVPSARTNVSRRRGVSSIARQSSGGRRLYFAPLSTRKLTVRERPVGPATTPSMYVSPTLVIVAIRRPRRVSQVRYLDSFPPHVTTSAGRRPEGIAAGHLAELRKERR